MSGAIGCCHLKRDPDGSCPECREATERMKKMCAGIPRAERLSPWDAADLRASVARLESALSEARRERDEAREVLSTVRRYVRDATAGLLASTPDAVLDLIAERDAAREEARAAREALREWVAAHDAEVAAAKNAARVRCSAYASWPQMPKRMPRGAKFVHELPPEEQARITAQSARDMAPIDEAEAAHRATVERLNAALAAARAVSGRGDAT